MAGGGRGSVLDLVRLGEQCEHWVDFFIYFVDLSDNYCDRFGWFALYVLDAGMWEKPTRLHVIDSWIHFGISAHEHNFLLHRRKLSMV